MNSTRVENANSISKTSLASAEIVSPQNISEISYIVITETPTPTPTAKPTPRPTRTPSPKPLPPSDVDGLLEKYASVHSVSKDLLKKIGWCESHLNAGSVNGIYGGMYQFAPSTWHSTRVAMNENPDPNLRFNAEEAIKTAAFKIARGGRYAWPNCGR